MFKLLRSLAHSPVLLIPVVFWLSLVDQRFALAQERQGCFMIDNAGRFFDLSRICPSSGEQALGTGDIQATLRWANTDDLDLSITDPSTQMVDFANREIPSGGQLDVDANANCVNPTRSPVENVFWPTSQAPQGRYSIQVNLYTRCGSTGPVPFTLTLLVQGTTQTLSGVVDDQNTTVTFPFTVPLQPQQPPQPQAQQPQRP